jgi:hypothetical protein
MFLDEHRQKLFVKYWQAEFNKPLKISHTIIKLAAFQGIMVQHNTNQ